jgi:hypothetical protein
MRYTAWIMLPKNQSLGCVLADISDTGGRIGVDNIDDVPETFTLWLAKNGSARRNCRVVWRSQKQVGVSFDRVAFDPEHVPLAPDFSIEADGIDTVELDEPAKPA